MYKMLFLVLSTSVSPQYPHNNFIVLNKKNRDRKKSNNILYDYKTSLYNFINNFLKVQIDEVVVFPCVGSVHVISVSVYKNFTD